MSMHDPFAPHYPATPRKEAETAPEPEESQTEEKPKRRTPVKRTPRKKAASDS